MIVDTWSLQVGEGGLAKFEVARDDTFKLKGKHRFKLDSGSYMLYRNNVTYSTGNGLLHVKHGPIIKGQDVLREYHE